MKKIVLMFAILFSINICSQDAAESGIKSLVLGSGCFWGAEKGYDSIPGVIETISGYGDGDILATYREITLLKNRFNPNNHAEVVKVIYDSRVVDAEEILKHFFESHDPTQLNRQGNDIGTQYRSIILTSSESQHDIALAVQQSYQKQLTKSGYGKIVTKIKPVKEFYKAEEYHQDYLAKNPQGYCPDHSTGVKFPESSILLVDNQELLEGKKILIVESESCPFCKKFRENVSSNYKGSISMTFRTSTQLEGITPATPLDVTPTILFLEDGEEVYGHRGYMDEKSFYEALGAFKLGDSEAYRVAFNNGTDTRFCKEYKLFQNTPHGVFIDKLSGDPLFDTKDRFNSGTGWLSFTKAIEGSVVEKLDTSFGMTRIEIRAKKSGIHLGHVFPDGPNGLPRYCINATVLDFQPRESKI